MSNNFYTRVLALNDDNHDTTFYFDNDITGYNMREFIKLLGKPHLENYHVRYVYLVDIPEEDIKATKAVMVFCLGKIVKKI